ncbi:MAG TPA: hypothetical protein VNQ77_12130 [Frankiaceae bacterium]|nr:hypothetical protein [Frankiaceae bacterium]
MTIHDEQDLRERLLAVSAATPPAPASRADSAVRRAAGIQRRRAAVAAVAVLVPAFVVGAVALRPAPSVDYASPASWPDRRDPALADLEEPAVADWANSAGLAPGERVHWLWSGRVPATGYVVMAFAVCAEDTCGRTVLQYGDEDLLREPGENAWQTTSWDIAPGTPAPPLSEYLVTDATYRAGPRTVLFVLPAPDAAEVSYDSPARAGRGGAAGRLAPLDGAFAGDVGYLAEHATITVRDEGGRVRHTGLVGDEDSVGSAERIDTVAIPPGYDAVATQWNQIGTTPETNAHLNASRRERALFLRCAAIAPMRVVVNGVETQVRCDGITRMVAPPALPLGGTYEYTLSSDDPYAVYVATEAVAVP